MGPSDRHVRIVAALIVVAGLAGSGLAILADELRLGAEAARGVFGWKRIALLGAGMAVAAAGALLFARPRIARRVIDFEQTGPVEAKVRIVAALIVVAGLAGSGLAILADELRVGAEAARGVFGWKRIALLGAGMAVAAAGALLFARPRIASGRIDWQRVSAGWERMRGFFNRMSRHLRSLRLPSARHLDLRPTLRRWRLPFVASGLIAVVALIPRAMTAGPLQHGDEVRWIERSDRFATALVELDFSAASATTGDTATMPGITTMWLGTIARAVWELGRTLGIVDHEGSFATSAVGLHLSQLAVVAATSLLIGLLVLLAWRWAGPITAIAAGALLATEPWLVAHGAVLHTDELAALFGATGALALLIALGAPGREAVQSRAVAALAGVLLAGAFLSKLSALLLAPGLAVISGWALVRAGIRGRAYGAHVLAGMRPVGATLGIALGAGFITTLVAWPAIWADSVNQIGLLRDSGSIAGEDYTQFFRGEITLTPGPLFYPVVTAFYMTPWFFVGMAAVIAAALVRETRARLAILLVVALPAFVGLSLASKMVSRYVILVIPFLALAVGIGIQALWTRLRHVRAAPNIARAVAGAVLIFLLAHAIWVAPWGRVYFNPLLGGSQAAERTLHISGSRANQLASELIQEREAPACDVTVAGIRSIRGFPGVLPCGSRVARNEDPDYLILPAYAKQRYPAEVATMRASGRTVGVVTVRGIAYVELIDRREQGSRASE